MNSEVMIVDDNPEVLESLERILSAKGFNTNCFANPLTAVNWYHNKPESIRLILLDLKMPVLSGEDCLEQIKQFNNNQTVALMSGSNDWHTIEKSLRKGADIFFTKPLDLEALLNWLTSKTEDSSQSDQP